MSEKNGMVLVEAEKLVAAVEALVKGLMGNNDEFQEAYHQLLHAADPVEGGYHNHFEHGDHFYEWKRIANEATPVERPAGQAPDDLREVLGDALKAASGNRSER